MTPQQVWDYYGNSYRFMKKTGMSDATLRNWMKWGFVPIESQFKLERITNGELMHDITHLDQPDPEIIAFMEIKSKIVKLMFSMTDKYAAPGSALYPGFGQILVNALSACVNEVKLQFKIKDDK